MTSKLFFLLNDEGLFIDLTPFKWFMI